ncbi:MAG: exosortase/archaeosortase family protein [Lentisphaerae bacterium]|nr:exosortase/archaeosortase family protein [Lentisphaerota bacterium]
MTTLASTRAPRADRWMPRLQWAGLALALFGLYLLSRPMLGWLRFVFREPGEDMGHGWLVPLFSLYLLWRQRGRLLASVGRPSWTGVWAALPLLALVWLGERGDQPRVTQVAVYGLLWALPCAFLGRAFARVILFPVCFLVFTVPLGFLGFFTIRLRMLTALFSSVLLNGIGIPVARVGTGLHCLTGEGFALDVADPCSGLRSIFALSALTAGYAYLTQRALWRKWLLFVCALPLAVVGNMARIFTIALVARFFGQQAGTGFYHDYSGYLVFIVGTLLMMQAGAWIARIGSGKGTPGAAASPPSPAQSVPTTVGAWRAVAPLLPLLVLAGMLLARQRLPAPILEPPDFLAARLGDLPGFRLARPWFCQNEQCRGIFEDLAVVPETGRPAACPDCGGALDEVSLGERTVLPADTGFLKGNYYDAYGRLYRVSVVINGASRQSIHRPELCLPAQGFSIERTRRIDLAATPSGRLPVTLVDLRRTVAGRNRTMGQVYFFVSAHHATASHVVRMLVSIRDRALFNRVTRWAMVVVAAEPPFSEPDRLRELEAFLEVLYPALRKGAPVLSEMKRAP